MYKVKRFSITDDKYWEEVIGKKLPPQYINLRKLEPKFKRWNELIRITTDVPVIDGMTSLDGYNSGTTDLEIEMGGTEIILMYDMDGNHSLTWDFSKNKYHWDSYPSKNNIKQFNDIKSALIEYLDSLVELRSNMIGGINSKIQRGQEYPRKGLMGALFGKGKNLKNQATSLDEEIKLIQEYRDYILRNLR